MAKSRVSSIPIALLLLSLLLASFLAFARAEEAGGDVGDEAVVEESAVLALDVSNFSEVVAKHKVIVVEFYAPWCGHCKKLAPEYEKAALILSTHDPPIGLAKIDASEEKNKELAKKYDVQGFPTIKIIKNQGNDVQDYNGPREADGIVNYLKKQVGPVSTEIKSEEDAGNLIDEKTIFIVGVFPEYSGKEFENFMAVAEILRTEYDFGHTLDAKFLPRGDLTVKGPLVRLFKPFDELFVDFQDFDVDALKNSIEAATVPMVVTFDNDPSNHPYLIKFFTTATAKAMLFLNFDNETFETFKSKIQEAAELYKGKNISFLIGDRDASRGALEYFGVKDDQVPLIIIQENDGQKYLKPNLEPVEIASWLKEYMDGTLTLYRKSEPIPEDNDKPVKVVVADNLHDVVFNSGKNVLLDFYAPWCRICKELEPILEEVAASFKNDDDVVIAKMDATANDIPKEFNLQGYPTLYFNSASGKLLTFDGNKTAEAIIDFVQKNKDAATLSESIKDEL